MADQTKINELNNCPICVKLGDCHEDSNHNCPRCGKFKINGEAKDVLREISEEERSLVSHVIREERIDFLDREKLEKILKNRQLPNPAEQINNAIKFLAKETKYLVVLTPKKRSYRLCAALSDLQIKLTTMQ
jgi:hypothetical protein